MKHFKFKIKDRIICNMNRKQYKAISHFLRYAAWTVENLIDWEAAGWDVSNHIAYNYSSVDINDLIKESKNESL